MSLEIHFLNVGHGDCTMIKFPSGRVMMIDINNSKSLPDEDIDALAEEMNLSRFQFKTLYKSAGRTWEQYYESMLVDPVDYFNENFSGESVFRYVQSHPDMDHMNGLSNFFWSHKIPVMNFWDTAHNRTFEKGDFDNSRFQYIDWLAYKIMQSGVGPDDDTGEPSIRVFKNYRGDSRKYWDEDNIEVLSPTESLIDACNAAGLYNNCSYVLKVSHAGRSVILPGDAEAASWKGILENVDDESLRCDVLKAAHHGRSSGFHRESVEVMKPTAVICSVGKKPSTDASSEYSKLGASVFSTRYHGTLKLTIWDDGDLWICNSRHERILTLD
ncbi:hypothetical protein L3Q65_38035 [Amycolatopsis sp. FU40]|uniref:ComEC/Rec2 family competence protein n=1 Tax=Amycolatopsis sp. FU40 TaxID=2914159 RepID=UPI001F321167|nr:hypothetical protein [Amycolatopsis sp. FU40]UKD53646.1 hypothetical protein L3Q65_38035 [Amycolatopsis sp. FU40]